MPKFKPHRQGVRIDMTPLVDVAFLLLTFFMLTTQFKPQEEVTIVLPSSHSDFKLPESDVLMINIANEVAFVGADPSKMDSTRIWLGVDSQRLRERIFKDYRELYIGKANGQLKQYGDKYMLMVSYPIPKSQLANYLVQARTANPKLRTVIKGDRDADYGIAEDVMDVLQRTNITRFNLVTDLARTVKE
jgi:biopolymer transport protein ExbD